MSEQKKALHTFRLPVLIPSLAIICVLIIFCASDPTAAGKSLKSLQHVISENFSWYYTLVVSVFLVFLIGLACSSYGKIRLGADDAEPEFSVLSWLAMLFAAGMGIGLMYYGVGEPLQHFVSPPLTEGRTLAAAGEAMTSTFLHWGFQPWAIYGVVGLVLAYFGYRYNLPLSLRSGLYPILRERIKGPWGHAVDVFALCCTLFGLAPSVGLGVVQLAAGIQRLTGWDTSSLSVQLGLIFVVISLAAISAATGVGKGVRRLSELNLSLAVLLMLFVLFAGPTRYLLGAFADNLGSYLAQFPMLTLRNFTYTPERTASWFSGWTILYWAWWISWSPFVGLFIARISRGRTIREFVTGVILVPSLFTFLWMTVFGNTVIWLDLHTAQGALSSMASNVDALLFRFFDFLPFSSLMAGVSVLLIAVFFVTSADSGSLMLDLLASRDDQPSPLWQRIFWAALLGVTAAVLLATGGQSALMTMALVAALPFSLIMVLLIFSLCRGLAADKRHSQRMLAPATRFWSGQHWRERLENILQQPTESEVRSFIATTVRPALDEVALAMRQKSVSAEVRQEADGAILLVIPQPNLRDFIYGVRPRARQLPAFALNEVQLPASERHHTWEAMSFFADGRGGYAIDYLRSEEIIADVLGQYERYLSLSHGLQTHLLNTAPAHRRAPDGDSA
ncbi:BCCT family transporter [Uliginosibacterium sp. H3]|uniref:BCCT family transporter n=1 Tax=Uliginosibacterium silvisoli TaxID=3114758 RepID=A0ABU6JYE5_9RHOO|nr:BCCT family transporter [Uliginosibacterium sp. H3]